MDRAFKSNISRQACPRILWAEAGKEEEKDGDSLLHRAGGEGKRRVPRTLPRIARVPLLRGNEKGGGEQHQVFHFLSIGKVDGQREAHTEGRRSRAPRAGKRIARREPPGPRSPS